MRIFLQKYIIWRKWRYSGVARGVILMLLENT